MPGEDWRLCLAVTGNRFNKSWETKPEEVDFFDLKGALQALAEILRIFDLKFSPIVNPYLSNSYSIGSNCVSGSFGTMGLVSRQILEKLDITNNVYLAEIELSKLETMAGQERHFQPLPKYPPVERDIAIIVDKSTLAQDIVVKIKSWAGGLAEEVGIFDVYQGKQVPQEKKSLAFFIRYRSGEKTLTEDEVNTVQQKIIQNLEQEFKAQLRS